jgi:DNA polymerase (family 10)
MRDRIVDKAVVAAILEDVANLMELTGENPFKVRAYQNAARAISSLEEPLDELVASGRLASVPGLGETLVQRIQELVQTGHMAYYEDLQARVPEGLRTMLRIPGLGPKKVRAIYDQLGITTIPELQAAAMEGRIAQLPGFGTKTQENILKGIAFLTRHQDHYLYPIAEAEAAKVITALRELPHIRRISVAGSLRRHKEVVKDIDIVASVDKDEDRPAIMDRFTQLPNVISITSKGDTKSSIVTAPGIAIDLRVVTDTEYPYALHHFTGSKEHNIALRGHAHAMGLKINEYGLFRGDTLIPCRDEVELYHALGMQYIEPELREDRGEIEAALANSLPRLITVDDIRGILHVHSAWSDGQASIREMAEACRSLGYTYLGICDHSKSATYAHGLSEERVRQQHEEIEALNAEYGGTFHILKGTECDILRDGTMDYSDEVLATFDFVVASIHSHFNLSEADQTNRLIRAIQNPWVSIIGHPTGRILLSREGYQVNMEAVIDAAGEHGVCIELNANPLRLDIDWRWLHRARERGVKIPINPDAHAPNGYADMRYGIGVARKGWLTAADVPNTYPAEKLRAFFAQQRTRARH